MHSLRFVYWFFKLLSLPELVSPVDVLLLETEYHRSEVLVVGEVVPVLAAVKVLLMRLLLHRGQPELAVLLPLLLDRGLLSLRLADPDLR